MHPVPWYRAWIYTVNSLLIVFQLIFLVLAYGTLQQNRFTLFPIEFSDVNVVTTFVALVIQFFTCFCGIIGVLLSKRGIVRVYWFLMIPMIAVDIIDAIAWAVRFSQVHEEFEGFLEKTISNELQWEHRNLTAFCERWITIGSELKCCPDGMVIAACSGYDMASSCTTEFAADCIKPLLYWLHSQVDPLAGILYFLLTPLKLTVAIVLRGDVLELFTEFLYIGNPNLYDHYWISTDSDEDDDLESSQNCSSSSEKSLLRAEAKERCLKMGRKPVHISLCVSETGDSIPEE
uniref:Tetraspanin n=1 Tax=Panagrellus redivivus TaxID=6233 RepID=A0A7E4VSD4_PANRE